MQKQTKKAFAGVVLAVALLVSVPVFAQDGVHQGQMYHSIRQAQKEGGEQAKEEAKTRAETIRTKGEERRIEIKQQVCERREEALRRAMPNLANGAASVKGSFDTVYERVEGFYTEKQLTVKNYDKLVANVDGAQSEAAAALKTIETFKFELDCENPAVGEQMASYRESILDAREALVMYRAELLELISAMRAEAATQNDTNSGEEKTNKARSQEGADNA